MKQALQHEQEQYLFIYVARGFHPHAGWREGRKGDGFVAPRTIKVSVSRERKVVVGEYGSGRRAEASNASGRDESKLFKRNEAKNS